MKVKNISLILLSISFIFSCTHKKVVLEKTPETIYKKAEGIKKTPLGKWAYKNTYFMEFKGEKERGTWTIYTSYGQGLVPVFSGKWAIYRWDPKKGIGYLRLDYEKIGLTNPLKIDPKTHQQEHKFYPYTRYQIVEYYCDKNYFGMNIYRKKDDKLSLEGEWEHTNYDWFDDFYAFSESPLWIDEKSFKEKILNHLNDQEKKFLKSIYEYNLGKYYRKKLTSAQEFKLAKIMNKVREKKGYEGEWFHLSLATLPNYNTYYVNRKGILKFTKYGEIFYSQESPFFGKILSGKITERLPTLVKDNFGNTEAEAKYILWESPVYNKSDKIVDKKVNIRIYNSSDKLIIGNWQFEIIIIKDYNILITYPFKRVK